MADESSPSWLMWIVAFKAVKTAALTVLGMAALFAVDRDPVAIVIAVARTVHLPTTSRLFARAADAAFRITPGEAISVAVTAFGYAVVMAIEGVGLYLRRRWARWFTIGATSSLVPLEIYEIVREPRLGRVAVLMLNVLVVVYLCRRKEAFE